MNDHHMIEWQEGGGRFVRERVAGEQRGQRGELLTLTGKARAPSNEWPQE